MAFTEESAPLEKHERRNLWSGLVAVAFFFVFSGGIMWVMATSMGNTVDFFHYVLMGFAAFFLLIIGLISRGILLDLMKGEKIILHGYISDKEHYWPTKKAGKTKSQPRYYFYFDAKKLEVQHKHYSKANVGDLIELHYAPNAKRSFSLEVLENAMEAANTDATKAPMRTTSTQKEYPLEAADIAVLAQNKTKGLRVRILTLVFFAYILSWPILSGYWGILLLFTPIIIWAFFTVRGILKPFSRHRKDLDEGVKIGVSTAIRDKSITNTRRTVFRHLKTLGGSFNVSQQIYDAVEPGDNVTIYKGKASGWFIGLQKDGEEIIRNT